MASTKELVEKHEAVVRASLQNTGLVMKHVVHFPKKDWRYPFGVAGVWLVQKAGGIIATQYMAENGKITNKESKKSR
jgi:hypothetical protein